MHEKILLIDNNPEFLGAMADLLSGENYRVRSESTPEDAHEALTQEHFHLVMSGLRALDDNSEHDQSGLNFLMNLPRKIPKILLVGFMNVEILSQAVGKVDGVAYKGDPKSILERIGEVLERAKVDTKRSNQQTTSLAAPFLKSVSLKNVGCLEHLDLNFSSKGGLRKWTTLLGQNGTGKSTILRSVALILAGSDTFPELLGTASKWIQSGKEACSISAVILDPKGKPVELSLRFDRKQSIREIFQANDKTFKKLDQLIKSSAEYRVLGYGCSRRLSRLDPKVGNETTNFDSPRAASVATMFSNDALLTPITGFAMDLDYRNPYLAEFLLPKLLDGLLPELKYRGIDKEINDLMFETEDGLLPLSQLSDGYQNLAAWTGDLLARIADTANEPLDALDAHGLVLVDEIELHLHPVWQRQLRSFIEKHLPNLQWITTTHAPLAAQLCTEGELFTLRRGSEKQVGLEQIHGNPSLMTIQELITGQAFGVATVHSEFEFQLRQRYRALKNQKNRTELENNDLMEIQQQLTQIKQAREAS